MWFKRETQHSSAVDRRTVKPKADIALLLEGTYPFVRGGVSSWVHQIISGLPDFTFALIFMGGEKSHYGEIQYELPDNVVHMEIHYLMGDWQDAKPKARKGNPDAFAAIDELHKKLKQPGAKLPDELMTRVFKDLGRRSGITQQDFLFSEESWKLHADYFQRYCTEPSFVDYFWSIRTMHAPLFTLARIAEQTPYTRVLHSVSTGYAGLLGAMLSRQRDVPFILTEHGIYTKERKIDLAQAKWIEDPGEAVSGNLHSEVGYIRRMWIKFFEAIGRLTYERADPIIALYDDNRRRQVADGAPEEKTMVIPNGIPLERFADALLKRPEGMPLVVGLIGRVVPIKDIKTFIRAMRTVCDQLPEIEGWIVGPEDEDQDYVRECKDLVKGLELTDRVKFLGFQNVAEILPQLGLMVLSSISEAQPLVILEGWAAGVPSVATDVGSCREMIYGRAGEDAALGAGGEVVPIADPDAMSKAILELLGDEHRWRMAQRAGLARVRQSYSQQLMYDSYQKVYSEALERSWLA